MSTVDQSLAPNHANEEDGYRLDLPDPKQNLIYAGAILLAFTPLMWTHLHRLWALDHYQYAPLLLLGIPFLVWTQRSEHDPSTKRPIFEIAVLVIGWILLAVAAIDWLPNVGAIAAVITAGALLVHFTNLGRVTNVFALWVVCWFMARVPANLDIDLIFWLQGFTSRLASRALDVIGINHMTSGHIIQTASRDFQVEEACSGIQSLFALLAATAVALVFNHRGWIHRILLFLAAAFWACMVNAIRVGTVVVFDSSFGIDIASGWSHELLGLVLFAFALAMLWSTDQLLLFALESDRLVDMTGRKHVIDPTKQRAEEDSQISESEAIQIRQREENLYADSEVILKRFAIAFCLLLVVQLGTMLLRSQSLTSLGDDPRLHEALTAKTLPTEIDGWKQVDFNAEERSAASSLGHYSKRWTYTSDQGNVAISVDFPFIGWHELSNCYVAQGCVRNARKVSEPESDIPNLVNASLRSTGRKPAHLIFTLFDRTGETLLAPGGSAASTDYWRSRLQSGWIRRTAGIMGYSPSYQVQLYFEPKETLSDEARESIDQLYKKAYATIVKTVKELD